jgi:hypothetical protein
MVDKHRKAQRRFAERRFIQAFIHEADKVPRYININSPTLPSTVPIDEKNQGRQDRVTLINIIKQPHSRTPDGSTVRDLGSPSSSYKSLERDFSVDGAPMNI